MDQRDVEASLRQESKQRVPGWTGADVAMALIDKGGSDRHYYRLTADGQNGGPPSAVLMIYTDGRPDNASFFPATEVLGRAGLRALRIFHHDGVRRLAWLEDLGCCDLWSCRDDGAQRVPLYKSTLRQAARLHRLKWEEIPPPLVAQLQPPFDEKLYHWEQNYFFDQFAARFLAAPVEEQESVRTGNELADLRSALAALPRSPVHRDFQSQNVIVRDGSAWLIDYQGLRQGRPEYDLASLLYDPYVGLTDSERAELRDYYFELRREDGGGCTEQILAMCACQRLMQALGAYGKLGVGDGKTVFLDHIRPAVANLCGVLAASGLLPSLREILTLRPGALEAAGLTDSA